MPKRGKVILLVLIAAFTLSLAACSSSSSNDQQSSSGTSSVSGTSSALEEKEKVTLSVLIDNIEETYSIFSGIKEKFEEKYPYITIDLETRPSGSEGENFIKTRLATGDMNDVFYFNSGALLQALNPELNMVDLTDEPFMDNLDETYKTTVSYNDRVYGVPVGSSYSGGWLYNRKVYEDLGLSVPKTWAELMENNEKIKEAGITPVIGSFKETWTTQLIVLGDYYNVQAQHPTFAEEYTANEAKFATSPAALRSFEKLQEVHDLGYWNEDYLATTYDVAQRMLMEGEGAHYPILTRVFSALQQNFPDKLDDIGFFPQPSDDPDINGMTVWMPNSAYINKDTEHLEEAKLFLSFIASLEGVDSVASNIKPYGPWMVKGATLPDDVPLAIKDMQPYIDSGNASPALEFLSPVKGPNLEHFTVEVGAGMKTALEGAESYDKDVEKQAQQLGLEGW